MTFVWPSRAMAAASSSPPLVAAHTLARIKASQRAGEFVDLVVEEWSKVDIGFYKPKPWKERTDDELFVRYRLGVIMALRSWKR